MFPPNRSTIGFQLRHGFTLVELLVVMGIVALLSSTIIVVYARSGENARIASTKTLIKQLDSALKDRVESFRRYSLTSAAEQFGARLKGDHSDMAVQNLSSSQVETLYRTLRFRGAFPSRLADMYGFDNVNTPTAGNPNPLTEDAVLWRIVRNRDSMAASKLDGSQGAADSAEILYLLLTEGETFGTPPLYVESINPNHILDTDGDGFLEFVDGWGQPLRFYNFPTGLLMPNGNIGSMSLTRSNHQTASVLVRSLFPLSTDPLPNTEYDNPLFIDPLDPIGDLDVCLTALSSTTWFQTNFHAVNTFWTPLIVSAGPDGSLGLREPTQAGLPGRCVVDPAALEDVYDNLTNQQRGGF